MKIINILSNTISLTLAFSAASCYQDIDLDKYKEQNGEHLLVINSIVNPDSTVSVMATKTYFFSDIHNVRTCVKNLDIVLKLNDIPMGNMRYDEASKMYVSEIKPAQHDRVGLYTTYRDSVVTATDVVPEKVKIERVTVSREGPLSVYTDRDYIFTYNITFTDAADEDNFYFLQYDTSDWRIGVRMGERDFTYEYVFQQLARHINANVPGWGLLAQRIAVL